MNKTDLVKVVSIKADISQKDAEIAVKAVFDAVSESLALGEKVQLVGFGTFAVKYRAAKQSKNPRTGEKITVPATYRPAFSAGKSLKEIVAKYKG
jgi:DNA-binding protein HU-beta